MNVSASKLRRDYAQPRGSGLAAILLPSDVWLRWDAVDGPSMDARFDEPHGSLPLGKKCSSVMRAKVRCFRSRLVAIAPAEVPYPMHGASLGWRSFRTPRPF